MCGEDVYIKTVTQAIRAGIDRVLLREKDLSYDDLYPIAQTFKSEMHTHQKLIVHSHVEVACAVEADGIQLTLSKFLSMSKNEIQELKQTHSLEIGVSIHSLEEALEAEGHGADVLLASHVFYTACKEGTPGRGCDFLQKICNDISIPVIGLGGIDERNLDQVLTTGACGVAVMSRIMASKNIPSTCESLLRAMKASLKSKN